MTNKKVNEAQFEIQKQKKNGKQNVKHQPWKQRNENFKSKIEDR